MDTRPRSLLKPPGWLIAVVCAAVPIVWYAAHRPKPSLFALGVSEIHCGLTRAQVHRMLGPPSRTVPGTFPHDFWEREGQEIEISFTSEEGSVHGAWGDTAPGQPGGKYTIAPPGCVRGWKP